MSCQLIDELTSLLAVTHFPPGGSRGGEGENFDGRKMGGRKKKKRT